MHTRPWTIRSAVVGLLLFFAAGAAAQTQQPFNGRNLDGWATQPYKDHVSRWTVGKAALHSEDPRELVAEPGGTELINIHGHGLDIYTTRFQHGDALIELELMVPRAGNSGIYLMGEYEVQVLDSYGKKTLDMGDMGAIYGAAVPSVNACKPAGQWQTMQIEFRAPRFDPQGNKIANAHVLSIRLNGQEIQKDVEIKAATPGGLSGKEKPLGPLMFQGNHGPVAFRNIRVTAR